MKWILPLALLPSLGFGQEITTGLVLSVAPNARTPVRVDPVELALLGRTQPFAEQEQTGSQRWKVVRAQPDGSFAGPAFDSAGYVQFVVECPEDRTYFLEATGHGMAYVNGEPRTGDIYGYGYASVPVRLHKGTNTLLLSTGRGPVRIALKPVIKPISFDLRDRTLPDTFPGAPASAWGAVVVRNATGETLHGLTLEAAASRAKVATPVGDILPYSFRKVKFQLNPRTKASELSLLRGTEVLDKVTINLDARTAQEARRETFVSKIDNSVQYYAVLPSQKVAPGQALFLSLHGASVEALGQAQAYGAKDWGTLVAATNRRPFGFDWEDVGRLDALEVLSLAQSKFLPDPQRIYLTGHSMGGHGTWQVGVHYPDKFAAIAPSAGWISFWTYAGGAKYPHASPVEQMLLRAMSPSDTLELKANYAQMGIFVLHGTADDNVPVSEARTMRDVLGAFHRDLKWHEQEGAGHWWDADPAPGADAVDYKGIFEFFRERKRPLSAAVDHLQFATSSPAVSSRCHWVEIEQQTLPYMTSSVSFDREQGFVKGTTANIQGLTLALRESSKLEIDGTQLPLQAAGKCHLRREGESWKVMPTGAPATEKNPERGGTFKSIFDRGVVFVYGTQGRTGEADWAWRAARFQAEQFWYRGNSSVEVMSDTAFLRKPQSGNVVLFGGASANLVARRWLKAIPALPAGDATLMIRPRPDRKDASFALLTGRAGGWRLLDRIPYFSAGASIPDYLVLNRSALEVGTKGVVAAGFFTNKWEFSRSPDFFAGQ